MRKLSFFVLISFIFIGFVSAQTITVTSPHAGDTWYKGHPYTIIWTKIGDTGVNVKINIFKDIITPANCIGQLPVPNSGSQSWTIPSTYANGTYYIRIKGADSSWNDIGVYGDSGAFTISEKKEIKIVFPNGGEKLNLGDFINITWEYEGITDNIEIILYYNFTYKKGTIASNIPVSDKSYRWRVGYYNEGTANPKSGYQIEIRAMDGRHKDRSHFPFTICPDSSAIHPDFEIEYLVMNREYNFQLVALVKNNGKSYIGPIDFKIIGIGKLTGKTIGKTTRSLNKLIYKQNISLDVPEKVVKLMNLNWPPDVTYISFRVEIDPFKRIEELNEMNNISRFYRFFREKTTKPDFLIGYIQYNSGHLYTLIKNEGYKYDGGQVEFRIIGMDRFMGGGKFLMDKRVIKSIPPLDTAMGEIINLCDIDWPQGVKNITFAVYIDPDNKIIELKENNNLKEQVINK